MKNIGLLMVLLFVAAILSGCGVAPVEKPLADQVIEADGVSWVELQPSGLPIRWTVYEEGGRCFLQRGSAGIVFLQKVIEREQYLIFTDLHGN